MTAFDDARAALRRARDARGQSSAEISRLNERAKQLDASIRELDRRFDPSDAHQVAQRERLVRQAEGVAAERAAAVRRQRDAIDVESAATGQFLQFSDPITGITRLDDSYPILLLPVRLETRFKRVGDRAAAHDELWLRIYPDDCWIDSFDATLTETELSNAIAYWAATWAAGGIEDQERGAWRDLVAAHGSGRASYIADTFVPSNPGDAVTKAHPQDVVLVVVVNTSLPADDATALATYWSALWKSGGDAGAAAAARAALDAAVGAAHADELIAEHQPGNFDARVATGFERADITVSVAYLVLPAVDTKRSAWSQQPSATILPDRFVAIGYRTADDANPFIAVGGPVPSPLPVGPNPGATGDDQLQHDAEGNLGVPDEIRWTMDFPRAVETGMGLRIDLAKAQAPNGFARLIVVGLRLNADHDAGQHELEALLRHHRYRRTGLQILGQGTPTNNTEAGPSGLDRRDDSDASFDARKAPLFTSTPDWSIKRDGQWFAELLGIDPQTVVHVPGADGRDHLGARAMNTVLWPATLGYWMESMMSPVFSESAVELTRDFFRRDVVPGGMCPAIRLGRQPYGILPTSATARLEWLTPKPLIAANPGLTYVRTLYPVLKGIETTYRETLAEVAHVGGGGDPHATLLDIVGLHPGSVEWAQRYAESLTTLFNRLNLFGFAGLAMEIATIVQRAQSLARLHRLGYAGPKDPPLLDLSFSGRYNALTGGVVDDRPPSEHDPIRDYTANRRNYIEWLIDAARTSLDALYHQDGFIDGTPPAAILFLMLRHALQLGYSDVSIRLHESSGLYTSTQAAAARLDEPILHVREASTVSESRYQPLYSAAPAITGDANMPVHTFIAQLLTTIEFDFYLRDQLDALVLLRDMPTAQLERLFADHVDACSYRLDAWMQGLLNMQITGMRRLRDDSDEAPRPGVYLGGYAWLEEVRPENKVLTERVLDDPQLAQAFAGASPIMVDSTNEGYVHAPSLNHAVTAAVLRNGYISNVTPQNPGALNINLSSSRVRDALSVIEGIRSGQSLASLLGYRFERGLHDDHEQAEVDKHILRLRREFPLRTDHLNSTKPPEGVSIEAIEANNVIDGVAFVEHMQTTKQFTYPFGRARLPQPIPANEAAAINGEAAKLIQLNDAVSDVILAEGVHQAVLGNYDRVASTYDAFGHADFPPEPEVVRTPLNGIGLTHRVALHLDAGASSVASPIPALAHMTPRAQAEPSLNAWIASMLPPLDHIGCVAGFTDATTVAVATQQVTLDQLGLQPTDLLVVVGDDFDGAAWRELDDRVCSVVRAAGQVRPDGLMAISYSSTTTAEFSVFEVLPLIRNLRRLATRSRPLRATDLGLMNEASTASDASSTVDPNRVALVVQSMQSVRDDLDAFITPLRALLDDLDHHQDDVISGIDATVDTAAALLARAAEHAVPQAGWGALYDGIRVTFAALIDQCHQRALAWQERLADFDAKIIAAAGATTDKEKFVILAQAERCVSTTSTPDPAPPPSAFSDHLVQVDRVAFAQRMQDLLDVGATDLTSLAQLLDHVRGLLPLAAFDVNAFEVTDHDKAIVRLAEDVARVASVVRDELSSRLARAATLQTAHDASADPNARRDLMSQAGQALLGNDFQMVPTFTVDAASAAELTNARDASGLLTHLTNPADPQAAIDEPLDEWLFGVARVREQLNAWEQAVVFAGSLGVAERDLQPLQLPFIAGDPWLGLGFPADTALDHDRLLYTAHFATPFQPAATQCGLLLDEWSETIPLDTVDTAVAFHYDRPNSEAPQVMLLVMPTDQRGTWRWDDLLDTLNDTLDRAKRRAVEPVHLDASPLAPFLPATTVASQVIQLTIALDFALNNKIVLGGGG